MNEKVCVCECVCECDVSGVNGLCTCIFVFVRMLVPMFVLVGEWLGERKSVWKCVVDYRVMIVHRID